MFFTNYFGSETFYAGQYVAEYAVSELGLIVHNWIIAIVKPQILVKEMC